MSENFVRFFLSIVLMLSSVCISAQQKTGKSNDSIPVIKIVGLTKIYSADKSFNDQLKNSTFFVENNDVTYKKSGGKVDSLFAASIENRNYRTSKKKSKSN